MNKHMDELRPKLEEMGEQKARWQLNSGIFTGYKKAAVEAWLHEKDQERREALETRNNRTQTTAAIAAIVAAVAATIGAIAAIVTAILS